MKKLLGFMMVWGLCLEASALTGICEGTVLGGAKIRVQIKSKPMDYRNAYVDQGYTALVQVFNPGLVEQKQILNIQRRSYANNRFSFEATAEGFAIRSQVGQPLNGQRLVQYNSKYTQMQYMNLWMDCRSQY